MDVNIKKWGNSSGIILPKSVLDTLHVGNGDRLQVISCNDCIVLKKIKNNRKELLKDLVMKVTNENKHNEFFTSAVGKEEW